MRHGIICQGNAQALTTISFQGKGVSQERKKKKRKETHVYHFSFLLYIILHLLHLADNGIFLIFLFILLEYNLEDIIYTTFIGFPYQHSILLTTMQWELDS